MYLPRTFKGHGKGVYPLIFIPAEDFDLSDGATFNPGDTIISGSADQTARSWSCDTGTCLKVRNCLIAYTFESNEKSSCFVRMCLPSS